MVLRDNVEHLRAELMNSAAIHRARRIALWMTLLGIAGSAGSVCGMLLMQSLVLLPLLPMFLFALWHARQWRTRASDLEEEASEIRAFQSWADQRYGLQLSFEQVQILFVWRSAWDELSENRVDRPIGATRAAVNGEDWLVGLYSAPDGRGMFLSVGGDELPVFEDVKLHA